MSKQQLPNKLSECIKIALHDLELCRKDSKYKIDFSTWHEANSGLLDDQFQEETARCSVCFAGSVMAQTLNTDHTEDYQPNNFDNADEIRLRALDNIRSGDVIAALKDNMRIHNINDYPNIHNIDVNQNNYDEFTKSMNAIIAMLEQYDL